MFGIYCCLRLICFLAFFNYYLVIVDFGFCLLLIFQMWLFIYFYDFCLLAAFERLFCYLLFLNVAFDKNLFDVVCLLWVVCVII